MASPPPNPDTRELPYGWIQQYNPEYKRWFYVNTHEQPPRSSWSHPLGPMPQGFAPPPGPPLDRSYNSPPYGGHPPPPQGYGGYQGYQPSYGQSRPPPQGYYNQGGFGGSAYGNRGYHEERVYVEEERRNQRKGPGWGGAVAAGAAGLLGGALLTEAFESHNEREREIGFEEGYQDGWQDNQYDNWGDSGW